MFPSFISWLSGSALAVRLAVLALVLGLLTAGGCAARRVHAFETRPTSLAPSRHLLLYPLVFLPVLFER
jgi:hypothetical protein